MSDSHDTRPQVDTLFYDGQCSLCASEIEQLRQRRGDGLSLVDIHTLPESSATGSPDAATPDRDELLRRLYLRRADGQWISGADANVAAWEGTRHGRLLSVLRWPLLRYPVDVVYALWARWRYARLYGRGARPQSAPQPPAPARRVDKQPDDGTGVNEAPHSDTSNHAAN